MTHDIKTINCPHLGWHAETLIHLGGELHLIFSTCRRYSGVSTGPYSGITTEAQVYTVTETCRTRLIMFESPDFSMHHDIKRATEESLYKAHYKALNTDEALKAIETAKREGT